MSYTHHKRCRYYASQLRATNPEFAYGDPENVVATRQFAYANLCKPSHCPDCENARLTARRAAGARRFREKQNAHRAQLYQILEKYAKVLKEYKIDPDRPLGGI